MLINNFKARLRGINIMEQLIIIIIILIMVAIIIIII